MNHQRTAQPFRRILMCLSLFLGGAHLGQGATIIVPGPAFSIQTAINSAAVGDTVLVGPGTYNERLNLGNRRILLRSQMGPGATTIDGGLGGTVLAMTGNGSEVSGFTITRGRDAFGAGIDILGGNVPNVIQGNIFQNNIQTAGGFGAAIAGNGTSPFIANNIFRNNDADNQFPAGIVSFVNGSSPLITNNLFYDNTARALNFILPAGQNPMVINNTFFGNDAAVNVSLFGSSVLTFRNNILVNNGIGLEYQQGTLQWENNLVFGNTTNYSGFPNQTGLNGNIAADPLFQNAGARNFMLRPGSPAIDAGSAVGAPSIDFAGLLRPQDGDRNGIARFDIGAFESPIPEPTSALFGAGLAAAIVFTRPIFRRPR